MKKILVPLVVLLLTFTMILPAAAAGNGPQGGNGTGTGICDGSGPHGGNGTGVGLGGGIGAGQGLPGGSGRFAIVGSISAVGTSTVTVNVLRGNKLAQPALNTQIVLTLTPQTRYVLRDGSSSTIISLADLKVGQFVSANGTLADSTWTTLRITVGATLSCLQ